MTHKTCNVRVLAFCLFLTVAFVGCQNDFVPSRGDVVGTWVLDSKHAARLSSFNQATDDTVLDIQNDGTFVLRDTVQFWEHDSQGNFSKVVKRAAGKWELESTERGWLVDLNFEHTDGKMAKGFKAIKIYSSEGNTRLRVIIGDPDQGEYLVYRKVPRRSNEEKDKSQVTATSGKDGGTNKVPSTKAR